MTRLRAAAEEKIRKMGNGEGIKLPPWAITLAISVIINLMFAAYFQGTVIARLDAITGRVLRIENQIDSITNITRSPDGYKSPPISRPEMRPLP